MSVRNVFVSIIIIVVYYWGCQQTTPRVSRTKIRFDFADVQLASTKLRRGHIWCYFGIKSHGVTTIFWNVDFFASLFTHLLHKRASKLQLPLGYFVCDRFDAAAPSGTYFNDDAGREPNIAHTNVKSCDVNKSTVCSGFSSLCCWQHFWFNKDIHWMRELPPIS